MLCVDSHVSKKCERGGTLGLLVWIGSSKAGLRLLGGQVCSPYMGLKYTLFLRKAMVPDAGGSDQVGLLAQGS